MRSFIRIFCSLLLIVALLCGSAVMAFASKSDDILAEIEKLQKQEKENKEQINALREKINGSNGELVSAVEQKMQLDEEIELLQQDIENSEQLLHQYNLLIAEKQAELDALYDSRDELFTQFQARIRAMQESGEVSYASVVLNAASFSDLLGRTAMIEEISKADQRMLSELLDMANAILDSKASLAEEKTVIELKRSELDERTAELAEKRSKSDALLYTLEADRTLLQNMLDGYEQNESALASQLAKLEKEYNEQKKLEERLFVSEKGFIFPVDPSGFVYVSSRYGYRTDPITGQKGTFHNGIDLASYYGTPVYASKTGEVTRVVNSYLYGRYVIINHGDGYSTYYGHLSAFNNLYVGQIVNQGDTIGYVGSSGVYSTGPHLHFGVYYNGSTVNPADYIVIP